MSRATDVTRGVASQPTLTPLSVLTTSVSADGTRTSATVPSAPGHVYDAVGTTSPLASRAV
jgi:hypothetical protein